MSKIFDRNHGSRPSPGGVVRAARKSRGHRFRRRLALISLRLKARSGLTLAEMSLALVMAAIMSVMVTTTVSDGLRMQGEADRMSVAVALAQTKLSQLLSNPNLSTSDSKGQLGSDAGVYAGYGYEVNVREEKIDLAKVAETGELEGLAVDDQLPAGAQNTAGNTQRAGEGTKTQTGGLVDIVRIVVKIYYPLGREGGTGEYRVETFRGGAKKE